MNANSTQDTTGEQLVGTASRQPFARHDRTYYAATANRKTARAGLLGREKADVCIVGGGFTGLSTTLTLAERGADVVLLETNSIGFGASGRNGGQVVNGLNASLPKIARQFGTEAADFVGAHLTAGADLIRDRIQRYAIDCDYKPGNLFAAYTGKQLRELESKQALWRRHGMDRHELLDQSGIRKHVASERYHGGMIDHAGGHLHPLNLAQGEADAVEALGGRIYELSEVVKFSRQNRIYTAFTREGSVEAKRLVLCGNAYLEGVSPQLEPRILPATTQMVATERLGEERARALLPTGLCVEDCRYILDYYRLSADHRLLFGGGTVYGGTDPEDIRAKLRPNLEQVFPQLNGVRLDYAWSGRFAISYSRVPQLGRLKDGTYFAHGYSGHGVTGSHLFGEILAEAIDGDPKRFDVIARFPYLPFPGGRALRVPYSIAGSWWYGLRDRLGV
ncbi:MAG: FAD-binding oxidoreductase [Pseudomonadota bacterium]